MMTTYDPYCSCDLCPCCGKPRRPTRQRWGDSPIRYGGSGGGSGTALLALEVATTKPVEPYVHEPSQGTPDDLFGIP